jgi:hypothetical protein
MDAARRYIGLKACIDDQTSGCKIQARAAIEKS